MERKRSPWGPSLSFHTPNRPTCTRIHTRKQAKKCSSVNTDPCERLGFMELIGGCMGTFPGGSFCLFFWWRRRSRRPSSSHHEDRSAAKRAEEECISAVALLWQITAEVTALHCKLCKNLQKLIMWSRKEWNKIGTLSTEKQWLDWQNGV